jgi:hypothetical protein
MIIQAYEIPTHAKVNAMFWIFHVCVCFGNMLRRLLIKEIISCHVLNLLVRSAMSMLGQITTFQRSPPSSSSGSMIARDDFGTFIRLESFNSYKIRWEWMQIIACNFPQFSVCVFVCVRARFCVRWGGGKLNSKTGCNVVWTGSTAAPVYSEFVRLFPADRQRNIVP